MLYVEPEQEDGALSVSCGSVQGTQPAGEFTATVCDPQEAVAVRIKFVPSGIFITESPETTPAEGFIETPAEATKFTVYVVPLQTTPDTPTKEEVAQGSMQFAGDMRVTFTIQFPEPAVNVTSVPIGMPETIFPFTTPAEAVTVMVGFMVKATELSLNLGKHNPKDRGKRQEKSPCRKLNSYHLSP